MIVTKLLPNLKPKNITKDQKIVLEFITKDQKIVQEFSRVSKPSYPNLYREYNRHMEIIVLGLLGIFTIGFVWINWWLDQ